MKKPLGGISYLAVINLTGIPDGGKSVLAKQFVGRRRAGYKVPINGKSMAINTNLSNVKRSISLIRG